MSGRRVDLFKPRHDISGATAAADPPEFDWCASSSQRAAPDGAESPRVGAAMHSTVLTGIGSEPTVDHAIGVLNGVRAIIAESPVASF
jgi:hypothetical protein